MPLAELARPDRGLLLLCVATIAAVAATATSISDRYREDPLEQREGGLVFPGLGQRVDAIATIEVSRASGKFTLARDSKGWANMGAGGFPARQARIESVIGGLVGLTYFEAKTTRARHYPKLEVEDVTNGAESTRLSVRDTGGAQLADIIVGKQKLNVSGLNRQGVYVRLPDDQRAWLAEGVLDVRYDAADWSNRRVVNVPSRSVRSMTIERADGETVALVRAAPDNAKLTLAHLPDDKEIEHQFQIDYLAGLLENISFDDAKRADGIDLDGTARFVVSVVSSDGLSIVLRTTVPGEDGSIWALVDAEIARDADSTASVKEEVKRIRTELAGWAFKLPRRVTDRLRVRLRDILKSRIE